MENKVYDAKLVKLFQLQIRDLQPDIIEVKQKNKNAHVGLAKEIIFGDIYNLNNESSVVVPVEYQLCKILKVSRNEASYSKLLELLEISKRYYYPSYPEKVLQFLILMSYYNSNSVNLTRTDFHKEYLQKSMNDDKFMLSYNKSKQPISKVNVLNTSSYKEVTKKHLSPLFESELLKDVLLSLQSLNGTYIQHQPLSEMFLLNSEITISKPVQDLTHKITEVGWCLRQLNRYITHKSKSKNPSLIVQALIFAIKSEITEYSIAINHWDKLLHEYSDSFHINSNECITLKKLYVQSRQWGKLLKFLLYLLDTSNFYKGCQILSVIFSYTYYGDEACSNLAKKILMMASRPIKYILYRFITQGLLYDPYNEFFVVTNKIAAKKKFWKHRFEIRKAFLPNFISQETAQMILMIGKTLNFIKMICQEEDILNKKDYITKDILSIMNKTDASVSDDLFNDTNLNDSIDIIKLDSIIQPIYEQTSKYLLDLVLNEFKLLMHLKGIGSYLLLGQGDFIHYLMDLLRQKLSCPANDLYYHNITGILENVIRSTNAQYMDPMILERLDCRILETSNSIGKQEGWDVFVLDYRVDGPLETIFSEKAMSKYHKIFLTLWKIKRLEQVVMQIWSDRNLYLLKVDPKHVLINEVKVFLNRVHLQTNEIINFINQLQYYIMFEVIECNKEELNKSIQTAKDLDMIISGHKRYLSKIGNLLFLNTKHANLNKHLKHLLDMVNQFDGLHRYMLKLFKVEENSQIDDANFEKNFKKIDDQLKIFNKSFNKYMKIFIQLLSETDDFSIMSLRFRMNFNEFYSN